MAGSSSRFPNLKPKWMLTHPNGKFMAIQAVSGLNLHEFDRIVFVCLNEHEEKFRFTKGFREELDTTEMKGKYELLYLKSTTAHQSETVSESIRLMDIKGPIFVKDSDNYFETAYKGDNSVCFFDLNHSGLIQPKNKSYIELDENGYISNIIEKNVISSQFCTGGYGFEDADDFTHFLTEIKSDKEIYLSNVIFQMILSDKKFSASLVKSYKDWGTLEDWDRYKRSYSTLFIDIDGTLVKNSSAHFPPYIGESEALDGNVGIIRKLYASGKFQIILTTSRPESHRETTIRQLEREKIPFDHLIMGLYHAKRILINDYSRSNPFKSCDAINLKRDTQELEDVLKDALGVDYNEI